MFKLAFRSMALPAIVLFLSATLSAQSHPFVSFDAPGAPAGTFPTKINSSGQIVGYYVDINSLNQGFVRSPNGTITEFSAPNSSVTVPISINNRGQIIGFGEINSTPPTNRGFLRSPGGNFAQIVYPGSTNTGTDSINDDGVIVGYYTDEVTAYHGFIRDSAGNYTSIDAPGAQLGLNMGTYPRALNANGDVAGSYSDVSSSFRGFLRDTAGNFTTFDAPGSHSTDVQGLNNHGDVWGDYVDASTNTVIAFIRHGDGTFITFSAPGATSTIAYSMTDTGYVCGTAISAQGVSTGFLRDPAGNLFKVSGPQPNNGGSCQSINNSLHTTGSYFDSSQISHGWVR